MPSAGPFGPTLLLEFAWWHCSCKGRCLLQMKAARCQAFCSKLQLASPCSLALCGFLLNTASCMQGEYGSVPLKHT